MKSAGHPSPAGALGLRMFPLLLGKWPGVARRWLHSHFGSQSHSREAFPSFRHHISMSGTRSVVLGTIRRHHVPSSLPLIEATVPLPFVTRLGNRCGNAPEEAPCQGRGHAPRSPPESCHALGALPPRSRTCRGNTRPAVSLALQGLLPARRQVETHQVTPVKSQPFRNGDSTCEICSPE